MSWTFLSNHGHVAIALARNPEIRMADLASQVGITERRAASIVVDLREAGYVTVTKQGRRNVYVVEGNQKLRHSAESDRSLGNLLEIFE